MIVNKMQQRSIFLPEIFKRKGRLRNGGFTRIVKVEVFETPRKQYTRNRHILFRILYSLFYSIYILQFRLYSEKCIDIILEFS